MRLELEDVHHVYAPGTRFEVPALRGVSLAVEPGEVLAVVGGTGSGKSTLAQHLNLLLKPTRGRLLVDGEDARGMKLGELRRRVGLVFQFPEAQLFESSVRRDVAFAPRRLGLGEDAVGERVRQALAELEISHLADRSPFSLSGGERRRAAIAGVLAMDPEVLVLDEPTAGLDPFARAELLGLVRRFRERGRSVVLISHDLDEVAEVADRVCVLERGRVRALGTPEEVFYANPALAPATVRVMAALGRAEAGRPVRFADTLQALKELLEG
ncbi:energy-coupling factor transporter ATPase [Rubrobacter taiwanensis]|uniref:Energy-coupling factor transporter ATPase n=1 Tax=Rubrobacter taiwanensis TaxID=185139 RepID=A0A4R1BLV8_9ACTN|nr:ATP-binding cassette domain-containing protein [Rubrobacter taiwanensis]TCJ18268.1 energy-coupling factor transporter ATPase [Rubrobacter taiwanensis]